MAKISFDLELDWLEEDETLDDRIKTDMLQSLESRVMNSVTAQLKSRVAELSEEKVDALLDDLVNTEIKQRIQLALDAPRTITDRYGDVVEEGVTLNKMITRNVEKAFEKKNVNKRGELTNSSFGDNRYTLLEYLISKDFASHAETLVKKAVEDTKDHVETMVADKVKTHVADNLTSLILENSSTLGLNGAQTN